jgi:DNA mismatch repair protein MutS
MGSRLLRAWLNRPLRHRTTLQARQDAIAALRNDRVYEALRERLNPCADVERIAARIALRSARPRDLLGLRDTLAQIPALRAAVDTVEAPRLQQLALQLGAHEATVDELQQALADEPPAQIKDGGVFRDAYDGELERLRALSGNADGFLMDMEARERTRTGIDTLKVGYNRVHGFYIEIGRAHASRIPPEYTRRQTLKNAERYITEELKQFEDQVLSARERALARERYLYERLLNGLGEHLPMLQLAASALAELDVLACLAERADALDWARPLLDDAPGVDIHGGRHPVVERYAPEPFVPNDVQLDDARRLLVITGPNMGGKSTYMRQTALIVLLACTGSCVPASAARIGPVDRIFTRIGAADDLASGQSTFMVEMTETANILHNASEHSLVLMDEIGRGTSTYDGLALAWACAEWLATRTRAFTLFATHYFELTQLAQLLPGVANVHLDAAEYGDKLVLLHAVREGPASRSFGLQVAALAGVPQGVIARARERLEDLERTPAEAAQELPQLPLFRQAAPPPPPPPRPNPVADLMAQIDPDALSPRQALELIYRIKAALATPDRTR